MGHRTEGGGGGDTEGGYQLNEPMTLDGISAEELIAEVSRAGTPCCSGKTVAAATITVTP